MFKSTEEIYYAVIATALLMIVLVAIIILAVIKYQNRLRQHLLEINDLKGRYQQEILKAQLEMKEQTLQHISQEIHDNVGQVLSLAKVNLNMILLEKNYLDNAPITDTKNLVGKAIKDLRNLSKSMNTQQVMQQKLSEFLRFELTLIERTKLYRTQLELKGIEKPLDPHRQLIISRMVQEILHNIIKHALGQHIFVVLEYLEDCLTLSIEDDGIGFNLKGFNSNNSLDYGTGIHNLHYRAQLIGARFMIDSQPGKGTRTQLVLPFF